MPKTLPPDKDRTSAHNVPITIDMGADISHLQTELRRANPKKPKRTVAFLLSDRIWEALEAAKVLRSDENTPAEKLKDLYRIFQITDPNAPQPKKR